MSETKTGREEVAVLRLAAGKANAMTLELLDELDRGLDRAEAASAAALVVTGYDRFFSAGLPLPMLVDLDRSAMRSFMERWNAVLRRVFSCPLPVVAAINGHAIAGGCVLALMADHRVMVDGEARIGLNEIQLGVGLPALVVEMLRLQVPVASLAPLTLEGRLMGPGAARELGLIHEIVPASELEVRSRARAAELAAAPSPAFGQIKTALRRPALETLARVEATELERWLDTWFSPDGRTRVGAAVRRLQSGRA
jgi:enoyl-CoA hydratase